MRTTDYKIISLSLNSSKTIRLGLFVCYAEKEQDSTHSTVFGWD